MAPTSERVTIVAVKIAKEGKGTNAVAMMCAGMPVTNLLGVPVGTFLSHMFSWRVPFVSCIVLGLITLYMPHQIRQEEQSMRQSSLPSIQFRTIDVDEQYCCHYSNDWLPGQEHESHY